MGTDHKGHILLYTYKSSRVFHTAQYAIAIAPYNSAPVGRNSDSVLRRMPCTKRDADTIKV